jgi:DNA mismatch repair protein MutL
MMPIAVLPEITSRVLRSAQIITKPTSLIKELIDNAIDARASSIHILISTNTLDRIEVRDNGHGIALDDLDALGRHGYTSKLRSLEELRTIGGSSLGFRGEALASAVELGEVTITTRTEGETAGVTIKLGALGGIASRTSASHPIGTTVRVLNFLSKIPVRKEVALKESKRALSAIKILIQAYALARLNLRLSLNVLKNEKANWSFYPRPDSGIRDIVSQIVGKDTAAQCIERASTFCHPGDDYCIESAKEDENFQRNQHSKFLIEAFLPSPNADASKIIGGQYVSVDSRPVSCARGTFKKIISSFKSHIRATMLSARSISDVKSPFIRLNIICPEGSYDPNVEPAKDNVLFEDEHLLLTAVDSLLESVYGNSACAKMQPAVNQNERSEVFLTRSDVIFQKINPSACNSTGLSAVKPTTVPVGSEAASAIDSSNCVPDNEFGGTHHKESWCPTNFLIKGTKGSQHLASSGSATKAIGLEDTCILPSADSSQDAAEQRDAKIGGIIPLNPWIIAKLNASTAKRDTKSLSIEHSIKNRNSKGHSLTALEFPTQVQSDSSSGCHYSTSSKRHTWRTTSDADMLQVPLGDWVGQCGVDRFRGSERLRLRDSHLASDIDRAELSIIEQDSRGVTQAEGSLCVTPAGQKLPTSRRQGGSNKPLTPLVFPQRTVYHKAAMELQGVPHFLPSRRPQRTIDLSEITLVAESDGLLERDLVSGVDEALDFERRKEEATRRLRKQLCSSDSQVNPGIPLLPDSSTPRSSPHSSRYSAAIAALDTSRSSPKSVEKRPFESLLADGDPRAYLMRRQKSVTESSGIAEIASNVKRVKTMLLPLETTTEHAKLRALVQVVAINVSSLGKALAVLANYDQYSISGIYSQGFSAPLDMPRIERKLEDLLKRRLKDACGTGEQINVSLDSS